MPAPNRRTVLKSIGATGAAIALPSEVFENANLWHDVQPIRFGMIADLHGGLAIDAEVRLDAFIASMAEQQLDAIAQLGDFAYPNQQHQLFADKLNSAHENVIHVIGNHEFDFGLKRADCYKAWGIESSYYRSDLNGLRILVLDGNEKGSPKHRGGYPSFIGKKQSQWLEQEIATTDRPVLIFSHQPLAGQSAIDNAIEIQNALSKHQDKIVMCLNGHSHVDSLLNVGGVTYLHVNSASYYWVGGKKRMAYYQDPLFSILTIDPQKSEVVIEGMESNWKNGDDPAAIGYFESESAPPETIVVPTIRDRRLLKGKITKPSRKDSKRSNDAEKKSATLKVMAWNIWGRLNQDPRYTLNDTTARDRTIEIIRNSGADIVAMIETYGSAKEIADALEFHFHTPAADANLCIFSRYPLSDIQLLDGLSSFSFLAATVSLPQGQKVRVYDIWLTSGGRHIVDIKNPNISDRAFSDGDDLRFDMLQKFLQHEDVQQCLDNVDSIPVIVAGDFNCVSHLDHHLGTRHSKLNYSRVLPIKASKAMHHAGFTDTFRAMNPDIVPETLGYTWTTVGTEFEFKKGEGFVPVENHPRPQYRNPYARIDFIYSAGAKLQPTSSEVISFHPKQSKRSFPEFPSDHAAVLTEFLVTP